MDYFGMILGGMIIGYFLYQSINAITALVAGPILGFRFGSFSFFGLEVVNENKRLKFRLSNFSWIPQTLLHARSNEYGKKIAREVISLVVGVILVIVGYILLKDIPGEFTVGLVRFTFLVMMLLFLWHLVIVIIMIKRMYGTGIESEIYRDCQNAIVQLEDGIHPKNLVFKSQEPDKDYFSKVSHRQYNLLNYYKELECLNINEIDLYIYKMEQMLPETWSVEQTPYYYEILYYYSALKRDIPRAETFATVIREVVQRDKDINGRRVYAAYLFYTGKDRKLALQVAQEGLEVVDKFPLKGQAYMERDLIMKLIEEMEEKEYDRIIER